MSPDVTCRVRRCAACTIRVAALAVLLVVLPSCASTVSWGRYREELDSLTASAWIRDLETLERELPRRHPNPYHTADRAGFEAALGSLRDRAASWSGSGDELADQMVAGIYGALAMLEEGHTTVNATASVQYPALIRRFRTADGGWELRVAYSDESLPEIRGLRVTAIGGRDPLEVLNNVSRFASAERPEGRIFFGQRLMADPRIMRGLGIAGRDGLWVTVAGPDGEREVVLVPQPVEMLSLQAPHAADPQGQSTPSRSVSFNGSGRFWYEVIGHTLYFRYNSSTTDAVEMMNEIVDLVRAASVERLVLDLRFNGGGNSFPGTRFVSMIADTPLGRERGRFYVLISENTFSSAIMTAVDAMAETEALFAGTPIATPVNGWGEVRRFALPESGLVIGHSTRFWDYTGGKNLRLVDGIIVPDAGLQAVWTFEEWVRGYDPALEAVLSKSVGLKQER